MGNCTGHVHVVLAGHVHVVLAGHVHVVLAGHVHVVLGLKLRSYYKHNALVV